MHLLEKRKIKVQKIQNGQKAYVPVWLNIPYSSSLIHRTRSKFCADTIPGHRVHLSEREQNPHIIIETYTAIEG